MRFLTCAANSKSHLVQQFSASRSSNTHVLVQSKQNLIRQDQTQTSNVLLLTAKITSVLLGFADKRKNALSNLHDNVSKNIDGLPTTFTETCEPCKNNSNLGSNVQHLISFVFDAKTSSTNRCLPTMPRLHDTLPRASA